MHFIHCFLLWSTHLLLIANSIWIIKNNLQVCIANKRTAKYFSREYYLFANILQTLFHSLYWYLSLKESDNWSKILCTFAMESKDCEWCLILQWSITLLYKTCRGTAFKLPNFRSIKKLFVEIKNKWRWCVRRFLLLTRRTMPRH